VRVCVCVCACACVRARVCVCMYILYINLAERQLQMLKRFKHSTLTYLPCEIYFVQAEKSTATTHPRHKKKGWVFEPCLGHSLYGVFLYK
jgi:hypothetical protein